jgi:hypothetical protein
VSFIYPLFAMFVLTLCVALLAFVVRVNAVRRGKMRIHEFKMLDLNTADPSVARTTRHIANLFEAPVFFYVVCLIALSVRIDDTIALGIAWTYVVLRVVHSFIHLTYNRVMHRMMAFMLSNLVLLLLWIRVLMQI